MTTNKNFSFEKELAKLNPAQKKAVETLDGAVIVVAGPGTGKTQVLTMRIANLIYTGTCEPQNILALTFTNAAAANMQKRLVEMIGVTGYRVKICTFHAFCSEVISANPVNFNLPREAEPLSDLATHEIMEKILTDLDLQALKSVNSKYYFMNDIISAIDTLKREGVSVEKFKEIVETEKNALAQWLASGEKIKSSDKTKRQKDLAKWEELTLIYEEYQKQIAARGFYDYSDMISLVAAAFEKNADLLAEYQEQFQYLLVDEYQDTNNAQDKILDLLTSFWGENANIFVVGDPNQSIYRFQGASLENFLGFTNRYPNAKIIKLEVGYRCAQNIYDGASEVVARDKFVSLSGQEIVLPKLKNVDARVGEKIVIKSFATRDQELYETAQAIKKLHDEQNVPYEKIAWLYRNNREGEEAQTVLTSLDIPLSVTGDINLLELPIFLQWFDLLNLVTNLDKAKKSDALFYRVLNYEWFGLAPLTVMKLARLANKEKIGLIDLILMERALKEKLAHNNLDATQWQEIEAKWEQIVAWGRASHNEKILPLLQKVFNESGLAGYIEKNNGRLFSLNVFYTFFRNALDLEKSRPQFLLQNLCETVEIMRRHKLSMSVKDLSHAGDAVQLSTVHKAKGLEWDYVFMTGIIDTHWGNEREKSNLKLPSTILQYEVGGEDKNAESARLFYVALTRAKMQAVVSYYEIDTISESVKPKLPSEFIVKLNSNETLIENQQYDANEKNLLPMMKNKLQPVLLDVARITESEKTLLQDILQDFVLSPSTLNQYLRDPHEFLHSTLLRMPKNDDEQGSLAFGNAIHSALETMYLPLTVGKEMPPIEFLQKIFERELKNANLPVDIEKSRLQLGLLGLEKYYQNHVAETVNVLAVEKNFGNKNIIVASGVKIKGKIDRLDLLENNQVIVMDYKTGQAKTDGEIMKAGKGASDREKELPEGLQSEYKRQLLFYKILVENNPQNQYQVVMGQLNFPIEYRDKKAVIRKVDFLDEEVAQMRELIKTVDSEIRSLTWLD